jgi:hypothetical protein
MQEATLCRDCDHVHTATRKEAFYRWRCSKFPVLTGFNPVDPDYLPDPPYAKCTDINHGLCPVFRLRREGQKELGIE